ncbi:MAG: hypothetical protein JW384_02656 [Nitrosomonadaceae bacterium]|nr:hypothetical protein [Nitrosomonadaceae bacterium]
MQNIVAPSVAPAPAAPSMAPGAIDYSWLRGDKPTQNLMAPMAPMGMAPMGMAPMGGAQYGTPSGMYNPRMDFGGSADGGTSADGTDGTGNDGSGSAAAAAAAAAAADAADSGNDGTNGVWAQGGLIRSYRYGGPVRPPYREEARQVAAQGRGPDTQLMHVTPKELRGLASLHPSGQLPRNPQTGLPEAGFLENVLPGILGTVVGSFVGMPWLGAVIGGIGTGLATGDLGKGLLSGLMSFGLGSAFSGLAEAGAAAAGTAGGTAAGGAASLGGAEAVDATVKATNNVMTGAGLPTDTITRLSSTPMGFFDKAVQGISNIPDKLSNIPNTLSNIGTGLTDPTALTKNALSAGTGLMSAYGLAQASNAPSAWTPAMPQQPTGPTQHTPTNLRTPTGYAPTVATGYGSRTGEGTFFAPNPGFPYMASGGGHVKALATGGVIPRGYDSYEMARGGIASMPSGMIRGPGAGMDDAINGTIDGRREVRLSDGEYVLSADVVSSIGDGSSEAGARRLKTMVENIREKKYGRPKQPGKLAGGLASLGMQAGGSVNKHPLFDKRGKPGEDWQSMSMYSIADMADDRVGGYGHLREDAHEWLADNDLSQRARPTHRQSYTDFSRDFNERMMAEDRFPMFADGGSVDLNAPD